MDKTLFFLIGSAVVWKATDFVRTFTTEDLHWKIPTEWWALFAWLVGFFLALLACNVDAVRGWAGLPADAGCTEAVLAGLGLTSVAAFLNAIIKRLQNGVSKEAPQGLTPSVPR